MNHQDFARLCLDRVRLAALGRAAEGSLSPDALSEALDVPRRSALEAIADLRTAGLTGPDDHLRPGVLREIAGTLHGSERPSDAVVSGEWTDRELGVLRTFFSGDRVTAIPRSRSKRRLVLERIAQDFEPGVRYEETSVNERLETYHPDYAALRRYLVDEGIMSRSSGVYWRSGGRIPAPIAPEAPVTTTPQGVAASRTPTLHTTRDAVVLVPFSPAHRSGLLEAADDERISRHMTDAFPHPYMPSDADGWIAKCVAEDPPLNFAVLVDDTIVGGVGCEPGTDILTGTAEIGWWISPRWWGLGIATLAVRRLIGYCFSELDLHRVEAGVFLTNPASARVADKAGLELEGIARDGYLKDGHLVDRLAYGLARSAFTGDGSPR